MQIPGVDFTESFSPVASDTTICITIKITLCKEKYGWIIKMIYIETAFLNAELTDEKEFEDHCFDFGLELEEDKDSDENIKVELPANRYDLFCVEGLALAF